MAGQASKEKFRAFFLQALNIAADNADRIAKKPIPRLFSIDLSLRERAITSVGDAVEQMYAGDRFYKLIDIAVTDVFPDRSIVFVRPDGRPDHAWEDTWDPAAQGPFRQILLEKLLYHTGGTTEVSRRFPPGEMEDDMRCSFCGKEPEEVQQIFERDGADVRICNECIELMHSEIQPSPKR